MVGVRVLKDAGRTVLVGWSAEGQERRAYLPATAVIAGQADEVDLSRAIPYGVPWAEVLDVKVTPAAIEAGLREAGIWTLADLQGDLQRAVNVLQRLYRVEVAALVRAAREYESGGK